jgi:hypothetical protein
MSDPSLLHRTPAQAQPVPTPVAVGPVGVHRPGHLRGGVQVVFLAGELCQVEQELAVAGEAVTLGQWGAPGLFSCLSGQICNLRAQIHLPECQSIEVSAASVAIALSPGATGVPPGFREGHRPHMARRRCPTVRGPSIAG